MAAQAVEIVGVDDKLRTILGDEGGTADNAGGRLADIGHVSISAPVLLADDIVAAGGVLGGSPGGHAATAAGGRGRRPAAVQRQVLHFLALGIGGGQLDSSRGGHQGSGHGSGNGAELGERHHNSQGGVGYDLRGLHRKLLVCVLLLNFELGGGLVVLQLLDLFLVARSGLYLGIVLRFYIINLNLLEGVESLGQTA